MFPFQLRDTRVEILFFLEKFLDRVSPRLKGWEKTYAVDIRVSYSFCQESVVVGFILRALFFCATYFTYFSSIHSKMCWICESLSVVNKVFSTCDASLLAGHMHGCVYEGKTS